MPLRSDTLSKMRQNLSVIFLKEELRCFLKKKKKRHNLDLEIEVDIQMVNDMVSVFLAGSETEAEQ